MISIVKLVEDKKINSIVLILKRQREPQRQKITRKISTPLIRSRLWRFINLLTLLTSRKCPSSTKILVTPLWPCSFRPSASSGRNRPDNPGVPGRLREPDSGQWVTDKTLDAGNQSHSDSKDKSADRGPHRGHAPSPAARIVVLPLSAISFV